MSSGSLKWWVGSDGFTYYRGWSGNRHLLENRPFGLQTDDNIRKSWIYRVKFCAGSQPITKTGNDSSLSNTWGAPTPIFSYSCEINETTWLKASKTLETNACNGENRQVSLKQGKSKISTFFFIRSKFLVKFPYAFRIHALVCFLNLLIDSKRQV